MDKTRDWGDVGVEGGPGAIRRAGDDPANDVPFDGQPNGETDDSPFVTGQANGGAKPKHFELIPFDAIKIDTTPAYLVKGIVPRVGLCVVWGPPKCGKSFLVFDLMMHVALGREYRCLRVRQGAVVYCALEGCAAFKNRVQAFRQAKLVKDASEVPFYLMAAPMTLVADHAALIFSIHNQANAPAAVIIDTLNRSLTGSESSDEDMSAYIKAADAIRDAFNCAVVIVHHCGHEGTRPRGHSSLMGAIDAQVAVTRDADDKIIATVELMKDGLQGESFASKLEVVELGLDDDGDKITSCVVAAVDGGATRKTPPRKLTKTAKIVLAALHDAISECGEVPPACNHVPKGVKCVTTNQWRTYVYKRLVGDVDEARAKQKAFNRGTEALTADNVAAVWNNYAWPCGSNRQG